MQDANSGHRGRLKARFKKGGLEGFHDYEALEILLTFAIPRRDVKPLAKELIKKFGGLRGLFEAGQEELSSIKGVGESSASLITLIRLVCWAYLSEDGVRNKNVASPGDVIEFLKGRRSGAGEALLALYLNSKNEILGVEPICEGPVKKMAVSPRAVIEKAFSHNARSVIFVHLCPGAAPSPVAAERELARALEAAATAVDILVHDHIMATSAGHLSARESGWLKGT